MTTATQATSDQQVVTTCKTILDFLRLFSGIDGRLEFATGPFRADVAGNGPHLLLPTSQAWHVLPAPILTQLEEQSRIEFCPSILTPAADGPLCLLAAFVELSFDGEQEDVAREKLSRAPLPTAVLWAGRSLIAFWRLDTPLPASKAVEFQRDFCARLGADADTRKYPVSNSPTPPGQPRPMRTVPAWHPERRVLFPGSGLWIGGMIVPATFQCFEPSRIYAAADLVPQGEER